MQCAAPAESAATRQGLLSLALPFLGRKLLQMGGNSGEAAASSILIEPTDKALTHRKHQNLKALHSMALRVTTPDVLKNLECDAVNVSVLDLDVPPESLSPTAQHGTH